MIKVKKKEKKMDNNMNEKKLWENIRKVNNAMNKMGKKMANKINDLMGDIR